MEKKKIHLLAGLPRSGSTLLANLLAMNPNFHATPTSPVLDLVAGNINMFSHNAAFKVIDRKKAYAGFANGLNAMVDTYYNVDEKVVFDKSRGWTRWLLQWDDIRNDENSKIIFTYRDPEEIMKSIESHHRKRPLLDFPDGTQSNGVMQTLGGRINNWMGDSGIVYNPSLGLQSLIEMGYEDRILIVDYKQLCTSPQLILDKIHEFIGEPKYQYDSKNFKDLKQTTHEYDTMYNEKFPHTITEGEVKYVERDDISFPEDYSKSIGQRFTWLKKYADEKTRMKSTRQKR